MRPGAVDEQLRRETATWRDRLDAELPKATALSQRGERFLENIQAYRHDCDHFTESGDLVRAFECVVWAWAWLEIGAETGDLDWRYPE